MDGFTYRLAGSTGCEILNPNGEVVAWAVDENMAMVIVAMLNWAEREGLSAVMTD